jgi:hypothetical protein
MKGIPKLIGCGIAISFFTVMPTMTMTHGVTATSDSLFPTSQDSTSDILASGESSHILFYFNLGPLNGF